MAASKVECPVCGGLFPAFSISKHVNDCLNAEEFSEDSDTPGSTIDIAQEDLTPPKKRLKCTVGTSGAETGPGTGRPPSPTIPSRRGSAEPGPQTASHAGATAPGPDSSPKVQATPSDGNITNHKAQASAWGSLMNMQGNMFHKSPSTGSSRRPTPPKAKPMMIGKQKQSHSQGQSKMLTPTQNVDDKPIPALTEAPIANKPGQLKVPVSSAGIASISQTQSQPSLISSTTEKTKSRRKTEAMPLAERMRPMHLKDYEGQTKVLGKQKLIRSLIEAHRIPSMILWGPPGCGKTTLARIIAQQCKEFHNTRFVQMSATTSGVADIKEIIKVARSSLEMLHKRTILFVDEIHRFNKLQQDTFLAHVEDGTIVLLGATTENPSFQVNNALLSRCRVITLEKLSVENIQRILRRALDTLGVAIRDLHDNSSMVASDCTLESVSVDEGVLETLAHLCDGDARVALNNIQMAVDSKRLTCEVGGHGSPTVTVEDIKECLQRSHVQYDRAGEEHYNCASALQKSIRGSDDNAAIYWLARMVEGGEDPLFIARRLVVTASEDIGLADPQALLQAVATFQACQVIGMPECAINLAQCVVYLARAPKSTESYKALTQARASIRDHQGPLPGVPLHLRNHAPTKLMKNLGKHS